MGKQITSCNFAFTDTSVEGVKSINVKSCGNVCSYFIETYKQLDFYPAKIILSDKDKTHPAFEG